MQVYKRNQRKVTLTCGPFSTRYLVEGRLSPAEIEARGRAWLQSRKPDLDPDEAIYEFDPAFRDGTVAYRANTPVQPEAPAGGE